MTRGTVTRRTTIGAVLLLTAWPSGAVSRLTMRVSPPVSQAPSNLVIALVVEPEADNRRLVVSADSAGFYRSSAIDLRGDRAARTNTFYYKGVPAGHYNIRAIVLGPRGETRASASQNVIVTTGPER